MFSGITDDVIIGAFTIANFGQNNDQTFCAKFGQTAPWEPNLDQTRCFGLKNCWSSRAPTVPNSTKLMNQTVPRTFADSIWNLNCIYRTLQNHSLVSSYCERSKETTKLCPNNPQNSLVLLAQLGQNWTLSLVVFWPIVNAPIGSGIHFGKNFKTIKFWTFLCCKIINHHVETFPKSGKNGLSPSRLGPKHSEYQRS